MALVTSSQAQITSARVAFISFAPAKVMVEVECPQGSYSWSFRTNYGGVMMGDRIEGFSIFDSAGSNIEVVKAGPGEFKANKRATLFKYEMHLDPPPNIADKAHVSWLDNRNGCLMLGDLLPVIEGQASMPVHRLEFGLPARWSVVSTTQKRSDRSYTVSDSAKAEFFVGRDLREWHKRAGSLDLVFVASGEWPFAGKEVTEIGAKILKDHTSHVGLELQGSALLMLAPLDEGISSDRWSAETRGSSTLLLLDRNSSRAALLGRLAVILSHELFHLWVPNALSFSGDYDWFFEGFTLYQALRSAVRLGFIEFQEYLDTIARVYQSYLGSAEHDRLSLLEAAKRRWTGGASIVYDKGMLVAFLCDLSLRRRSGNRLTLDDLYRELFRGPFLPSSRVDGNEVLASMLGDLTGDRQFVRSCLEDPGGLDLETLLPDFGLKVETRDSRQLLRVAENLNKAKRELVRALGYRVPKGRQGSR